MSLLEDLRSKMRKGNKTPSLKSVVRKATGCSSRHIYIPDKHMDLVNERDAKEFLAQDRTDRELYVKELFDCDDYARNVYNNARNYGLEVLGKNWAWAVIWIRGHALNLYVTEALKVVFIETQTDRETTIKAKTIFVGF